MKFSRTLKVELGSVFFGVVTLNSVDGNWTLGYEGVLKFSDITLTNRALVDASGTGTGSINIHGSNFNITNGSFVLIQNQGTTSSGNININASDSLAITGASPDGNISSSILTEALNGGKGGDIEVSAQRLVLQDGARVGATTYSNAVGGNLIINASDSVQLLENRFANPYRRGDIISSLGAGTVASGDAGSVFLSTNYLLLTDGGTLASTTLGTGKGNNITVNANSIDIRGVNSRSAPSTIAASAFNAGDAGSLLINTKKLQLTDGGVVNSAARATSNAGDVTINADLIEVTGESANAGASRITSSIETSSQIVRNIFNLPSVPSGSGGNVTITTKVLNLNQGGRIDARNQGIGDAGTLSIRANLIKLSNNGAIAASTVSGNGGNIFLGAQNLQLRQSSTVTASAGNSGNGGNVTIKGGAVAVLDGSSITANAYEGRGGNIRIDGQGVFISPDSVVSATSEKGIDGSVKINGSQNDLSNPSLVPTSVNTPGTDVCAAQAKGASGEFVNAGSGGLPQTPSDPLGSAFTWDDQTQSQKNQQAETESTQEIVEAQGWKTNPDGTISFTSTPSEASAHSSATNPPCLNAGDSTENVANNSQEITIQQPHKKPEE